MKIGILADTHENMPAIARAVELFNREGVALVLHAGDIISPITAGEFEKLKPRLIAVFGNNDGEKFFLRERFEGIGTIHERKWEGAIGSKKVLLVHEPFFLEELASSGAFDIIVYGHTHRAKIAEGKTLVFNPGECGGWLTGRCTVGLLETETMKAEIREI